MNRRGFIKAAGVLAAAMFGVALSEDEITVSEARVPQSVESHGSLGDVAVDDSYLYVCLGGVDGWRRIQLGEGWGNEPT